MHHPGRFLPRECGPVSLRCHATRKRGIQYSRGLSNKHERFWNTGSPDPAARRSLGEGGKSGDDIGMVGCLKFESIYPTVIVRKGM